VPVAPEWPGAGAGCRGVHEVVIVGGGPAGLSAALLLGRCGRDVLVFDDGRYRNSASHAVHGLLSRDGARPADLLAQGRRDLGRYGIEVRRERVTAARRRRAGFEMSLASGALVHTRRLLLATGLVDVLPPNPGLAELFGTRVFQCPYCDGWEVRGGRLIALGRRPGVVELGLGLTTWAQEVIVCSDGRTPSARQRQALRAHGVGLRDEGVVRLSAAPRRGVRIEFARGASLVCTAVFVDAPVRQRSALAAELGCRFDRRGAVEKDDLERTGVPGLFVAGDASRDVNFVAVAVAEGLKAGFAINRELRREHSAALKGRARVGRRR
jgi:thioredoxin reductase